MFLMAIKKYHILHKTLQRGAGVRHTLVNQEFPEAHFLGLCFGRRCNTYSVSLSIAINQFANLQWGAWRGACLERAGAERGDISVCVPMIARAANAL